MSVFGRGLRVLVVFVVVCVVGCLWVPVVSAQVGWWHMSSSSRPTFLHSGVGKQEVQQVRVDATGGIYALRRPETGALAVLEPGASAELMQQELESPSMYGPGNVEVSGGPGDAGGTKPYVIKFKGGLADRPLQRVLAEPFVLEGGGASVSSSEVSRGAADGVVVLSAANLGEVPVSGGVSPVQLVDRLPAGLEAVAVEAVTWEAEHKLECVLATVTCTFTGSLAPFELIEMRVTVKVIEGFVSGSVNEGSVSGGEVPEASIARPLQAGASTPAGVENYELAFENAGGSLDTQAGSHPFQMTTTTALNETADGEPAGLPKELTFQLPAGFIGNPSPFTQCTLQQFLTAVTVGTEKFGVDNECPASSAVGVTEVTVHEPTIVGIRTLLAPVFNIEPSVGEPARLGFLLPGTPVFVDFSVRTGGDYGLTAHARNLSQVAGLLRSEFTIFGVPGAVGHSHTLGAGCLEEIRGVTHHLPCHAPEETSPPAFLSLPTSCNGPMQTSVEMATWDAPGVFTSRSGNAMPELDGCNRLAFEPSINVTPDDQRGSSPTGLTVGVHVPQDAQLNAVGDAQSNVKNITVTLPEHVTLNPSAAGGLDSCSEGLVGYLPAASHPPSDLHFTPYLPGSTAAKAAVKAGQLPQSEDTLQPGVNFCGDGAKIATVTIKSPLLPRGQFVEGAVYLASPQNFQAFPQQNPFETHVAMYIVAEDPTSGTLLKLPGKVELGGQPGVEGLAPGQIRTTFENNPQLAFEDAELHFFGGARAPLASPAHCGNYTTNATFTPWSANAPVASTSTFAITSGPNGSPCPGPSLPFNPTLASGTTNINAGSFTPLVTTLSRPDGNQDIQSVTLHYPPGVSGLLAGVELCPEPQANQGTCGPNSQVGETIVSVGVGGDPFSVTGGKAYITGPYNGSGACTVGTPGCAPFGLSISNPAVAGPFNLQEGRPVIVRAKVEIDPHTSALTIITDPSGAHAIPTIIEGFPLQIQHVNVIVNRPGFTFNPTNCNPTKVTGQINSAEGASSPVSVPFQSTNCAALKFAPSISFSTSGKTSKQNGASLITKVTYPKGPQGTYANLAYVKVELPKVLPSRLTTLQRACTSKQFEANPAGCPKESMIGHATVHTPLLPVPLTGPAIFVSHGGEAFPSLTMVLQGYGVTIDLVGTTFISKAGITSTTFKTVPDQPFSTFELTLPQGKFSALGTNKNLCSLTKTVTTKKRVRVHVRGKTKTVTRKTTKTVTESLVIPNEFVAQNGTLLKHNTKITVTGCPKHHKPKTAKQHKKSKKGKKK
jgi:hypothetical protein